MSDLFNLEDHAAAESVEFIARNEARTVEFKALLMQVIV